MPHKDKLGLFQGGLIQRLICKEEGLTTMEGLLQGGGLVEALPYVQKMI